MGFPGKRRVAVAVQSRYLLGSVGSSLAALGFECGVPAVSVPRRAQGAVERKQQWREALLPTVFRAQAEKQVPGLRAVCVCGGGCQCPGVSREHHVLGTEWGVSSSPGNRPHTAEGTMSRKTQFLWIYGLRRFSEYCRSF